MLYFVERLNTIVTTNEDQDDRYLESFIRYHFEIADFGHNGYRKLIQRRWEHGRLVSSYKSPHIGENFEYEMDNFLKSNQINWDKMFVLKNPCSLSRIREVFSQHKMWIFDTFAYPKIERYYPQNQIA